MQKDYSEIEKSSPIRKGKLSQRVLFKSKSNSANDHSKRGRIIAIISKLILIQGEDNQIYDAQIRGVIESDNPNSSLIAVGDWVHFKETNYINSKSKLHECIIQKIEKRNNLFSRKAVGKELFEQAIASNIDNVMIMASVQSPDYDTELIDRFLITAKLNGLNAFICLNKVDLDEKASFMKDFDIYSKYDFPIFRISLKKNMNIDKLIEHLKGKETLLIGQSGVGKSTFINYLFKEQIQKVNELSEIKNKGQHTTTFVRMFDYHNQFKIIDSPGINEFDIWGLEPRDLKYYYSEFAQYQDNCEYNHCTHIHEPNCAVLQAVEKREIPIERYKNYYNIFKSLE